MHETRRSSWHAGGNPTKAPDAGANQGKVGVLHPRSQVVYGS